MAREFRVGDRVRCIENGRHSELVFGEIYTVHRITRRSHGTYIYWSDENQHYNQPPNCFELVSREVPIETLIKRVNLGFNSLKELREKHPDSSVFEYTDCEPDLINSLLFNDTTLAFIINRFMKCSIKD